MSHDTLIVGGGIGGAVLANLLARGGKRVVVLEKNLVPPPIARPEILWPHTVDFLRTLIPAKDEHRWLLAAEGLRFFESGALVGQISGRAFQRAGIQPWSTAGRETRRLLLEQADCEVLRGVEVRGLLKEKGAVVGVTAHCVTDGSEREWRAPWTIGDDGPGSLVRRDAGIPLTTQGANLDMLSFGCEWPQEFAAGNAHIFLNPRHAASGILVCACIPQPEGRAAGIIGVRPRAFEDEASLRGALAEFAGQDPRLKQILGKRVFPRDFVRVQLKFGNSPTYVHPGAALIGDAAHPVTPAGGQGANLAIADARCLADAILRGNDPFLADYNRIRRRAATRSLRLSRGAAWAFSLPESALAHVPLSAVVRLADRWPSLLRFALRTPATAFQ
ncbi:MAG: FAD-dependent oxidoreductase [Pirellulaceae bacterium]